MTRSISCLTRCSIRSCGGGSKDFYQKPEIDLDIARPLTATMHKMHRAGCDNYVSEEFVHGGERLLIKEDSKKGFSVARGGTEYISTDLTKKEE